MQTFIKRILSFFKSDWALEDYPIRFRHSELDEPMEGLRGKPIPWIAQVVNWLLMAGYGQTKDEAYEDLKRRFNEYKNSGEKLPRPGTRKKPQFEFAPRVQIEQYEDVARDFFEKILNMDYDDCLITDESSLWDFPSGETNAEYHQKIVQVYGVDVSDIESGNLAQIFHRICEHRKPG